MTERKDGELAATIREYLVGRALVSPAEIERILSGDLSGLKETHWRNELCSRCDHERFRHSDRLGGHCKIIGIKQLTRAQEKRGMDDTLYCNCGHTPKTMVPREGDKCD